MGAAAARCWWWWWWWVTGMVVLGKEECVVLENTPSSPVPLPANLTLRPSSTYWWLDLTILEEEEPPRACVRVEGKGLTIVLFLLPDSCQHQPVMDPKHWAMATVLPGLWSTLQVNVSNNTVFVKVEQGEPALLQAPGVVLPHRGLLQVTKARQVEAAARCRGRCPGRRWSSGSVKRQLTVKELAREKEEFYFRPGDNFGKLNFELDCKSVWGGEMSMPFTDLTKEDIERRGGLGQWHKVTLEYIKRKGVVTAKLDNNLIKEENVSATECFTFTRYFVRTAGESFFSFSCDPAGEGTEGGAGTEGDLDADPCEQRESYWSTWDIVVVVVFSGVLLWLIVFAGRKIRKWEIEKLEMKKIEVDSSIPAASKSKSERNGDDPGERDTLRELLQGEHARRLNMYQ